MIQNQPRFRILSLITDENAKLREKTFDWENPYRHVLYFARFTGKQREPILNRR